MKENIQNIQTALLVLIAATVVYGTFLQDSTPSRERSSRNRKKERVSNVAAAPIPGSNTKITADPSMSANPPVQNQVVNNPTSMAFNEMAHDFGTIDQNSENTYVFNFTNTGDKPLIIETATGSCGCTVPEFPREPIAPGATSEIKVVYKPGKQKGLQNKTITVIANTQPKDTRLSISANVLEVL
mgnify:CR=1 FL=1